MKTSLRILGIACALFCVTACTVYKPVDQPADVLFSDNSEIGDYLSGYEIFYHSTSGVYNIKDARTSGDTIYGYAVKVDSSRLSKSQKNDMNIFVGENSTIVSDSTPVAIHKSEIKNVALMGRDGRATFLKSMSAAASLVLIIVLIIVSIGLIGVSVWASAASSDGSNASSDQSSDSNSNSGDSGSGASSDASGGSGCYIATMVYGSYEADEVWVLRRFRDDTLQHSRFGRWFINWYYSWSPGFVKKYSKYSIVHRTAKCLLQPIIWLLK